MNIRYFIIFTLIASIIAAPALAGTKYMSGGPALSAAIAGSNEFVPGQEVTIPVMVENKGLIDMKFVQSSIVERDDLPNTAKMMIVALYPGDAPLVIRTDPQMVGDIHGGKSAQVSFVAKIKADAPAGEYLLPLQLHYTYLRSAEQFGQDSIDYSYKEIDEILEIPVKIKPLIYIKADTVATEHLNAGNEGYINLTVRNAGFEDAESAIIKIARNGESPVIPTDSSVYIGDFPINSTTEIRFKVAVSRDAGAQTYPLDFFVVYKNHEGDTITSDKVTIGVPVGGKIDFSVISPPQEVKSGQKTVIEVVYENAGAATAYSAQARVSAVDPFTSNDDTAYIGDIEPGQKAVARYEVSIDGSATLKEYGLDSEIRYRDALGNSQISDTMKVRIKVGEGSGINPILVGILVIAAIGGAAYYVLVHKKKN
ncbi:MAG TPA: S-layer protein [Methanoregulaceae archaeon]|nr:S-layer protein [Methanoregulaceae archaeon]